MDKGQLHMPYQNGATVCTIRCEHNCIIPASLRITDGERQFSSEQYPGISCTAVGQLMLELLRDLEEVLFLSKSAQDSCYVTAVICKQMHAFMCCISNLFNGYIRLPGLLTEMLLQ